MILELLAKVLALYLVPIAFAFAWEAVRLARMTPAEWEYEKVRRGYAQRLENAWAARLLVDQNK